LRIIWLKIATLRAVAKTPSQPTMPPTFQS